MEIDARGQGCPKPVLMAEEVLKGITEGVVEILVDNEGSSESLLFFARNNGFVGESVREGQDWRVKIVKGYACGPHQQTASSPAAVAGSGIFMVIATDTMGKDEELGTILMKGFLETLKVTKEVPSEIFFLNTGVRLTTINDDAVAVVRDIEALGAEIFSCGTCLKHYGLEDALRVGFRGTTMNIIEGMKECSRTVWIG